MGKEQRGLLMNRQVGREKREVNAENVEYDLLTTEKKMLTLKYEQKKLNATFTELKRHSNI